MRVTRLDECGNPPAYGEPNSFVVTKGFIQVSMTAVNESGTDITELNADGDLCINDRSRDQWRRFDVELQLCNVDPGLLEIVAHVALEEDWNSDIVGIRTLEGAKTDTYALEVWPGIPGEDCVPGEPTLYGYLLLPFVVPGSLGDITIENGATTFTTMGFTRAQGGWGVGPYDVVEQDVDNTPGPLLTAIGDGEHHLLRTTKIAPPDAVCGAQAMI